jgi:hypothetical protein
MEWIICLFIAGWLYWYFILRPSSLDFWKLAGKYPDMAYDFFKSKDCWKVFENCLPHDYKDLVPSNEWAGPFRLWVPKLGNRMIFVFGERNNIEPSQKEFISKIRK